MVIGDHLLGYPVGGFVGVDVFFVISGFVITGSILREQEKSGTVSFRGFYRRRIRRIIPLALLVLSVTIIASWGVFAASRAKSISEDGIWSLAFAANWKYAIDGTDYMQAGGPVSPLQHFWSLAVEEQFYIVWPMLVVLTLGYAASKLGWSPGRAKRVLGYLMLAVVAGSFAYAIWDTATTPAVAYFSTFSRAWELGIGALIAVGASRLARIPESLRPAMAYTGLIGVCWSVFGITPAMSFPAPWAAVPVLSTALVIAAGCGSEQRFLVPLTNPLSGYVGGISYSLYLWHFPVIIFIEALIPERGVRYFVVSAVVTTVLSTASYSLVENPIRRSSWLSGKQAGTPSRSRLWCATGGLAAVAAAGLLAAALVVANQGVALTHRGGTQNAEATLSTQISDALGASNWPELEPGLDSIGPKAKAKTWIRDGCLAGESPALPDPYKNASRCEFGRPGAAKSAVVLGDSMAISYADGIRAALEPAGYRVYVYTMQQCPAVSVTVVQGNKSAHPQCDPFRAWALGRLQEIKPDVVFMTSYHIAVGNLASGAVGKQALDEWREGSKTTLDAATRVTSRVFVLDAPPGGKNLQKCATKLSVPADCVSSPDQRYTDATGISKAVAISEANHGVTYVDTKQWVCSKDDKCPAFAGGTPIFADGGHLTSAYSERLAPAIVALAVTVGH
jgi:peptidoglycan/LPS O-acetylase OafA/YrhL